MEDGGGAGRGNNFGPLTRVVYLEYYVIGWFHGEMI